MTSKHGQHSKPAAQMLHCPSKFMDFACPRGMSWGGGGGYCLVKEKKYDLVSFNMSWVVGGVGIIKQI